MTLDKQRSSNPAYSSRREVWVRLLGRPLSSLRDLMREQPQHPMRGIGDVPNEILAEMAPVWMNGRQPDIRSNGIYQLGRDRSSVCVYPLNSFDHALLRHFDCGKTVATISHQIAEDFRISHDSAFKATRRLFEQLSILGLCHPAAAHVTDKTQAMAARANVLPGSAPKRREKV